MKSNVLSSTIKIEQEDAEAGDLILATICIVNIVRAFGTNDMTYLFTYMTVLQHGDTPKVSCYDKNALTL